MFAKSEKSKNARCLDFNFFLRANITNDRIYLRCVCGRVCGVRHTTRLKGTWCAVSYDNHDLCAVKHPSQNVAPQPPSLPTAGRSASGAPLETSTVHPWSQQARAPAMRATPRPSPPPPSTSAEVRALARSSPAPVAASPAAGCLSGLRVRA